MRKGTSRFKSAQERRDYYREYHRRRRSSGDYRNPCPGCDGLKDVTARFCKSCSDKRRHEPRLTAVLRVAMQAQPPPCPYCETTMRPIVWHRIELWHCAGCGLETTPIEINRFRLEEAA